MSEVAKPSAGGGGGSRSQKPLLMVDIDGVISLFGFSPTAPPAGGFHAIDGIPHFLSATAGEHLLRLAEAFELVWASGWEEKANEHLPHLLGLPAKLPYLSLERAGAAGTSLRAHWKLAAIEAFAGSRPLAWIDDAFNAACDAWAAEREAPTLLVATEPQRGLTERELSRLLGWAEDGRDLKP